MASIRRDPNFTVIKSEFFEITFSHYEPRRVHYALTARLVDTTMEETANNDGTTLYIPEKYWYELQEVMKLARQEADTFYAAVNEACSMPEEPDGSPEDYLKQHPEEPGSQGLTPAQWLNKQYETPMADTPEYDPPDIDMPF